VILNKMAADAAFTTGAILDDLETGEIRNPNVALDDGSGNVEVTIYNDQYFYFSDQPELKDKLILGIDGLVEGPSKPRIHHFVLNGVLKGSEIEEMLYAWTPGLGKPHRPIP
jgi:hypothetical protein